jgi:hypothetical protein
MAAAGPPLLRTEKPLFLQTLLRSGRAIAAAGSASLNKKAFIFLQTFLKNRPRSGR